MKKRGRKAIKFQGFICSHADIKDEAKFDDVCDYLRQTAQSITLRLPIEVRHLRDSEDIYQHLVESVLQKAQTSERSFDLGEVCDEVREKLVSDNNNLERYMVSFAPVGGHGVNDDSDAVLLLNRSVNDRSIYQDSFLSSLFQEQEDDIETIDNHDHKLSDEHKTLLNDFSSKYPRHYRALMLRHGHGKSFSEIAEDMQSFMNRDHYTRQAAEKLVKSALRKFKKRLTKLI